ncbi:MAG: hypothetical protein ACO3MW_05440 [Rhodospirillales bacterium]|jgi:hypothetical protein
MFKSALILIAGLIVGGALYAPAQAADLPYRQMALQQLHCKSITNQRRQKNCLRNATRPITAQCQKLRGQAQISCYRRHNRNMRAALLQELRKRRK